MRVGSGPMFASVCLSKLSRLKAILFTQQMVYENEIKVEESNLDFLQNIKTKLSIKISKNDLLKQSCISKSERFSIIQQPNSKLFGKSSFESGTSVDKRFKKKETANNMNNSAQSYIRQLHSAGAIKAVDLVNAKPRDSIVAYSTAVQLKHQNECDRYSVRHTASNIEKGDQKKYASAKLKAKFSLNVNLISDRSNSPRNNLNDIQTVKGSISCRNRQEIGTLTGRNLDIFKRSPKSLICDDFNTTPKSPDGKTKPLPKPPCSKDRPKPSIQKSLIFDTENETDHQISKMMIDMPTPRSPAYMAWMRSLNESPIMSQRLVTRKLSSNYEVIVPRPFEK